MAETLPATIAALMREARCPTPVARAAGVVAALALLATACRSGSRSAPAAGATASAAPPAPIDTAAVVPDSDAGPPARPHPPILHLLTPAHPGLELTWREPTPCDAVEVEREDALHAYPSQVTPTTPGGVASFTVPGATMLYLDATATMNYPYTYHARCRVAGVASGWSNELATNPTTPGPAR